MKRYLLLDFLMWTANTLGKRMQQHLLLDCAVHPTQDSAQGFGKLAVVIALLTQRPFVQAAQEGVGRGFFGVPLAVEVPHRTLAAVDLEQFSVFDKQAKTVRNFSAATGVVHQQQRVVVGKIGRRAKFFGKIVDFVLGGARQIPMPETDKFGGEVDERMGHGFLGNV